MQRRKFIGIAGVTFAGAAASAYLLADKKNFTRTDMEQQLTINPTLHQDERTILSLASLAPSGHNTQPWFVRYSEPFHWIICNDKSRWLPAVDPSQRETVLSIGAFMQNLEYAAGHFGYSCQFNLLAQNNQAENVVEAILKKVPSATDYDIDKIRARRTVRFGFKSDAIKKDDLDYLVGTDVDHVQYFSSGGKESSLLDEQTIEANMLQVARDSAQAELSDWIRFSSNDAKRHYDGLTPATMEIKGFPGFIVRNFYGKLDVMKKSFRDKSIDQVREQVANSAGWMVITSTGNSVGMLIETGMRMQRLFLKVRSRGIAIHPMTQILEENSTNLAINSSIGITDHIQFLLRTGYVADYPDPVSLRRPVEHFLKL